MDWGRTNVQFLAVGLAAIGSAYYVAAKVQQLQDRRDVFEAKFQAARAEFSKARAVFAQLLNLCCNRGYSGVQYTVSDVWLCC